MPEVLIIGAGISGLACAWRLKKLGIDTEIVEAATRAGGVIRTENIDGYRVVRGAKTVNLLQVRRKSLIKPGCWTGYVRLERRPPRSVYLKDSLANFQSALLRLA